MLIFFLSLLFSGYECSTLAELNFAVHVQLILKALCLVKPGNHRTTESMRLEKISKIPKSNPNIPHRAL